MAISEDLKKLARDAVSDIGNTYQNMLWQDAGFAAPSQYGRSFDPRVAEQVDRTAETIETSSPSSPDKDDMERE